MKVLLLLLPVLLLANQNNCKILDWQFEFYVDLVYVDNTLSCENAIMSLSKLADKQKFGCPISKEEDLYAIYTLKNIRKECPDIKIN
jgi:hypothetical protein